MRKELDALLCERYPEIFRDRHGDMRETCMCWGFSCGDGWFDIIDNLCREINELVKSGKVQPVVATQVKEKWGSLNFYIAGAEDAVWELIEGASEKSHVTCEHCGQPGTLITDAWYRVRCGACEAESVRKRAEAMQKMRSQSH